MAILFMAAFRCTSAISPTAKPIYKTENDTHVSPVFPLRGVGGRGGGCIAYHQVHKDDGNHENKDDKSQVRQSAERKLVVQIRIQEVVLVIEFAHHHDKRLHHGQRQVLKLLLKLMKEENVKIIYGPMTFFFFFSTMCG